MYLNTRIFPTTGYARVLLFMFIGRELGGTGTECLFQFTYCEVYSIDNPRLIATYFTVRSSWISNAFYTSIWWKLLKVDFSITIESQINFTY